MNDDRGDSGGSGENASSRKVLELAALETSGEVGYRELTMQRIIDRAELGEDDFYRWFVDAPACYAAGYASTIDELTADLVAIAGRKEGWIPSMRSALEGIAKFVATEPLLAKGLLLEVHGAGGAAADKRNEVFERLTHAIDGARRETGSRHSPPPITARFILNMIDAVVSKYLVSGEPERFAEAVPELHFVAVSFYFGQEAAEAGRGRGGAR